ncbi:hypothetical protein TNCV_4436281, partial [Trichonephila clavipes]
MTCKLPGRKIQSTLLMAVENNSVLADVSSSNFRSVVAMVSITGSSCGR